MELSLIPLAVVLLFLSGAGSRTSLAEGPSASTGLIRLWLTGDRRQSSTGAAARNTTYTKSLVAEGRELQAAYRSSQGTTARRAQTEAQQRRYSLLHRRFGVASAVFFSTAPPLA